jgi:hypothetical protein
MSFIERTAKKLLPILKEVKKRMIREKKSELNGKGSDESSFEEDLE